MRSLPIDVDFRIIEETRAPIGPKSFASFNRSVTATNEARIRPGIASMACSGRTRLSPCDTHRVLRIIPELYRYAPTDEFLKTALHLLHELIDNDHSGWTLLDYTDTLRLTKIITAPDIAPLLVPLADVLQEAVISHPYSAYFRPDRMSAAVRLSDMPNRPLQAYRTRYEQIFRVLDVSCQLTLPLVSPDGSIAALSLNRGRCDFTERDREILNVLQPHMQCAYTNARLIERGDDPNQLRRACEEGFGLTEREAQIAFWVAQGKTNPEVAIILGTTPRTVEKHVEHVLEKIGVENRIAALIEIHNWSRATLAATLAASQDAYHAGSILIEAA